MHVIFSPYDMLALGSLNVLEFFSLAVARCMNFLVQLCLQDIFLEYPAGIILPSLTDVQPDDMSQHLYYGKGNCFLRQQYTPCTKSANVQN